MRTNNIIKALIVIAIFAFVISGVIFRGKGISPFRFWWTGIFSGNTNYNDLDDVNFDNTYSIQELSKISIDTVSANCELIPEDRSDIRVVYLGKGVFTSALDSDNLNITESFKRWSVTSMKNGSLKIFIPRNLKTDLRYYGVSGSFKGSEITGNDLWLKTVSGKIEYSNFLADKIQVISVSGSLQAESSSFETAYFKTVSGKILVEVKNSWDQLDAESISGSIDIKINKNIKPNVTYSSISGKLHSDFGVNNSESDENTIKIKTVSGSMYIKQMD